MPATREVQGVQKNGEHKWIVPDWDKENPPYDCDDLRKAVAADFPGMNINPDNKFDDPKCTCPEGTRKIAAGLGWVKNPKPERGARFHVVKFHLDYHFWRQEASGKWTHKPGNMAVRRLLMDPGLSAIDRHPYTTFCGYFCIPQGVYDVDNVIRNQLEKKKRIEEEKKKEKARIQSHSI